MARRRARNLAYGALLPRPIRDRGERRTKNERSAAAASTALIVSEERRHGKGISVASRYCALVAWRSVARIGAPGANLVRIVPGWCAVRFGRDRVTLRRVVGRWPAVCHGVQARTQAYRGVHRCTNAYSSLHASPGVVRASAVQGSAGCGSGWRKMRLKHVGIWGGVDGAKSRRRRSAREFGAMGSVRRRRALFLTPLRRRFPSPTPRLPAGWGAFRCTLWCVYVHLGVTGCTFASN